MEIFSAIDEFTFDNSHKQSNAEQSKKISPLCSDRLFENADKLLVEVNSPITAGHRPSKLSRSNFISRLSSSPYGTKRTDPAVTSRKSNRLKNMPTALIENNENKPENQNINTKGNHVKNYVTDTKSKLVSTEKSATNKTFKQVNSSQKPLKTINNNDLPASVTNTKFNYKPQNNSKSQSVSQNKISNKNQMASFTKLINSSGIKIDVSKQSCKKDPEPDLFAMDDDFPEEALNFDCDNLMDDEVFLNSLLSTCEDADVAYATQKK